jgi:DNA-directed RNA polymerase specialized sigma24 family protein
MNAEPSVQAEMLLALPSLRAFALSLTDNSSRADDLVQGTLTRALTFIDPTSAAQTSMRGCLRSCATYSAPSTAWARGK